jgi:hypothetical protein
MIQKNLARNNNGSRNNKPCPNPNIMEILSFSRFSYLIMAICSGPSSDALRYCSKRCAIFPLLRFSTNGTMYRFTDYNKAIYRYIPYTIYRLYGCRRGGEFQKVPRATQVSLPCNHTQPALTGRFFVRCVGKGYRPRRGGSGVGMGGDACVALGGRVSRLHTECVSGTLGDASVPTPHPHRSRPYAAMHPHPKIGVEAYKSCDEWVCDGFVLLKATVVIVL